MSFLKFLTRLRHPRFNHSSNSSNNNNSSSRTSRIGTITAICTSPRRGISLLRSGSVSMALISSEARHLRLNSNLPRRLLCNSHPPAPWPVRQVV